MAKRLELLRELVPGAARVAVLVNPANALRAESTLKEVQAAAGAMGLEIEAFNGSTSSEINAAFARMGRERPDALFISNDPSSRAGGSKSSSTPRVTRSRRHIPTVNIPRSAG